MAEIEQKLGDLTVAWLTRFLKNQQEQNPTMFLPQFGAEELVAKKRLLVAERAEFPMYDKIYYFGQTAGAPGYTAPWSNLGGSWMRGGYYQTADGLVHLQGMLSNNTTATAAWAQITQLPPGFRPLENLQMGTVGWNGAASATHMTIQVDTDGKVYVEQAFTATASYWLGLNGVYFKPRKG